MAPSDLLLGWLRRALVADAMHWLEHATQRLATRASAKDLYLFVSLAPRKTARGPFQLTEQDRREATTARDGWRPDTWSIDQAARVLLLLSVNAPSRQRQKWFEQLCISADPNELVALYGGLPVYDDPEIYLTRAMEGARSNMKAVFEAVAHNNPYPAEKFPDGAWNHLVLKAVFIGSALGPIHGLDQRANPDLARMLSDYAHERWAAGRNVTAELWRCIGPHADNRALDDLAAVLHGSTDPERQAAALALSHCPHPGAADVLDTHPELAHAARSGLFSWAAIARPTDAVATRSSHEDH